MQNQTLLNDQTPADLRENTAIAIVRRMEDLKAELKQVGPEWDGPGSITPESALIDHAAAWLAENWHANLGTPDICPTAGGGVSISWDCNGIEHSIDVSPDGASLEWCQYNPNTLQTAETQLPMDQQGWDAIQAGLKAPAV